MERNFDQGRLNLFNKIRTLGFLNGITDFDETAVNESYFS